MDKESKGLRVRDFIREKVDDWDDPVLSIARFKAFSGQKSDWEWEWRYLFWKDLILSISHHFNFIFIKPSQLINHWFSLRGLSPLCLHHVLHTMYIEGHIIRASDMLDPRTGHGHLSLFFRKLTNFIIPTSKTTPHDLLQDHYLLIASVLKDRAAEVVNCISSSSNSIITMMNFHNICGGPDQATAILSYLFQSGKARYLFRGKNKLIEGVKVSISTATVPSITTLDYDILHLIWTIEKLQQQLDVIDRRYDTLRKSALDSLKSGNKRIALKYARELKINTESREKVSSLLNRVEEVLNAIADAESTKTVTEAIQIGARAMKEHEISWEELQHSLEQLDGSIDLFKQVANAIDSASSCSVLEDEDIEEEFKKFELEVIGQNLETPPSQSGVNVETVTSVPDDSLNEALSNLKLVEGTSTETVNRNSTSNSKGKRIELEIL